MSQNCSDWLNETILALLTCDLWPNFSPSFKLVSIVFSVIFMVYHPPKILMHHETGAMLSKFKLAHCWVLINFVKRTALKILKYTGVFLIKVKPYTWKLKWKFIFWLAIKIHFRTDVVLSYVGPMLVIWVVWSPTFLNELFIILARTLLHC